jgi:hypothetical protein
MFAVPVVPIFFIVTDAAKLAIIPASKFDAPPAKAAEIVANTQSPAPTGSIGSDLTKVGMCVQHFVHRLSFLVRPV